MRPIVIEDQTGADIATTFAALTDIEHAADYITAVDHSEMVSDGPLGPGARWRETRTPVNAPVTHEVKLTAYDPPKSFAIETPGHGTLHRTTYELEPVEGGATHVWLKFESEPVSTMAKIASPLGALLVGPTEAALKKDLKEALAEAERRMLVSESM